MKPIIDLLNSIPLSGLMLTVALGYALSRLKFRGITLGPAGATILVALILGQAGVAVVSSARAAAVFGLSGGTARSVGALGGLLFIYTVGYDAGPDFLGALRSGRGLKFALVGMVMPLVSLGVVLACAQWFALDPATAAGLLSGAMTNAASFASSSAVLTDSARLAVSFALAFPFGLAGFGLALQIVPRLLGQDLARGTRSETEDLDDSGSTIVRRRDLRSPELFRTFRVRNEAVIGKTLAELQLTSKTGCVIACLRRDNEIIYPDGRTVLQERDVVEVVGRLDELERFTAAVGHEIYDAELTHVLGRARRVRVQNAAYCGRKLADFELMRANHCIVVRVERGLDFLEPNAGLVIARDDVLDVVGPTDGMRAVARATGHFESHNIDTNIALFAGGLLLGLLIGSVKLAPFGISLSVGSFGGVLLAGIIMGAVRKIGWLNATIPRAARHLIRDFGLLLFIAETGLRAGTGLTLGMVDHLWQSFVTATLATIAPVVAGLVFGRYVLRLRVPDAWGSIAGGMTSSTLPALKRYADSNEPAVSFVAAYAAATLVLTIAGQLLLKLM